MMRLDCNHIMSMVVLMVVLFTALPVLSVTLAWDAVTTNEDGTQCLDLAGYRIYINKAWEDTTDQNTIEWSKSFVDGTYDAYVTAFDTSGNESLPSNTVTFTEAVKPSAPGGCRVK